MSGGEEQGKMVCVTGASGYVASWIVKLLLERGYIVNATIRDPAKAKHLMELERAKERLHLFKADLMTEGSFDDAVSGCEGVFHVASPVNFSPRDPQADVLDPAVKGTINVLTSCKRSPSVKRVVFTSSLATSLHCGRSLTSDQVVDESWFSQPQFCQGSDVMWYVLSKTLAEDAAWKFTKKNGIDMISVSPGMVIGPMLQPTLNDSVVPIFNLVNGTETYPDMSLPWVHVEDVAEAHIRAFEIPSANGRYCLAECVAHFSQIINILKELYPSFKLPNKGENDGLVDVPCQISKEKAKSLGIKFIPLQVAIKDTVESLKANNFIKSSLT
nr:dihydroflavonol-4-reductase [Bougainvillea spectabilis]